jgi:hypothetical protein
MLQKIEAQGFLFILSLPEDSDPWDGIGYPFNALSVWQCPLTNAEEMQAYNDLYTQMVQENSKLKTEV